MGFNSAFKGSNKKSCFGVENTLFHNSSAPYNEWFQSLPSQKFASATHGMKTESADAGGSSAGIKNLPSLMEIH